MARRPTWWSVTSSASSRRQPGSHPRRDEGQLEREHAPPPDLALRPDPSAVRLHDRSRDGEPDARSAVAARARRVDAVEPLEQEGQVLGRDPRTRIDDTYLAPAACDRRRDD